jgi:pyroglutamyl-peptidase
VRPRIPRVCDPACRGRSRAHDAIFTSLPVRELSRACVEAGVPATLSLSAGSFLCNEVMYRLLADGRVPYAGFVHVPQLPEQSYQRGGPMMEARIAAAGLHAALEHLAAMIQIENRSRRS